MAWPGASLGVLAVFAWTVGGAGSATAETLLQSLSSAYKFNPRLDAARATLRATDEEVPRALSGYRPSITGSADTSYRHVTTSPGTTANGESNPRGYQVGMVQPLFRGFRTVNAVNAAEATVRAGRETLRLAEQSVLLEAVTAFSDVVRDAAIVRLRENNVTVLTRDLRATQDRFNVGEVTRTDVAQAQARRAAAVAALDLARANLKTIARHLRAGGRPSAEQPGGGAGQHAGGQDAGRERRDLAAREPERGGGALPRAGGALQHRPGAGRAAADGAAGGQLRQALRRHGRHRLDGDDAR